MLHLSHYYACYYALLFLLYQQQQQAASSLTVIIDGATTSEWATRDQYKRIVEQHQNQQHQSPAAGNLLRTSQNHHRLGSPFLELPVDLSGPQEQPGDQVQDDNGNRQRPLDDAAYQQPPEAAAGASLDQHQLQLEDPGSTWLMNAAAARSLEDLASAGDRSEDTNELLIGNPASQLAPRIRGRESQLRKYCGYQLMDVLELVCQGRYYGGQPEIVEPSIKSRRSSRSRALHQQQQQHQPHTQADTLAGKEAGALVIDKPSSTRNRHSRKVLYRRIREEALWRGVTKECCDNPCRMEDLKNYCQPT